LHLPELEITRLDARIGEKIAKTEQGEEREWLSLLRASIGEILRRQKERIADGRERMKAKDWFKDKGLYRKFTQHCLVPRLLFSEVDALFAAHFVLTLCHFSNCEMAHLNMEILRCFHFLVLSATSEEARSIGIFLAKLLKYNVARTEGDEFHERIASQMALLLRCQEEFVLSNTILVLDAITKYFPKIPEHISLIEELLTAIPVAKGDRIETTIKRYRSNRQLALDRRRQRSPEAATAMSPTAPSVSFRRTTSTENFRVAEERRATPRSPVVPPRSTTPSHFDPARYDPQRRPHRPSDPGYYSYSTYESWSNWR
jgi:hypothetical protein